MAWPEATVVYPDGLIFTGAPGWALAPGFNNDRDVRFVDALIEAAQGGETHAVIELLRNVDSLAHEETRLFRPVDSLQLAA